MGIVPARREDELGVAETQVSPDAPEAVEDRFGAEHAAGDQVGTRIDHFVLDEELGRGGMGTLYVARDVSLDRRVAIKMLRAATGGADKQDRLLREARAQARLTHPNVVHIYYIGRRPRTQEDGSSGPLFFAMELVEGVSLDSYTEQGTRLGPERARQYMLQVARGLRAAERVGIIHRDIKPSNLLIDRDDTLKIADFGLAKPVEDENAGAREGAIVGSPLYIAPEQARDAEVDHRADMYSLGATFYHLLAGEPPFDGRGSVEILTQHLQSPAPSLAERAPGVPRRLRRIVERLMAKEPDARYASYDELIHDLEKAAPEDVTYAGFWLRSVAFGLDALLAAAVIAVVGWSGAIVHLLHVAFGHAWRGRTMAKYLLNIQVQRVDGGALKLGRSCVRTLAASWLPLLAGIVVATTEGMPELKSIIERLRPGEMYELRNLAVALMISHGFLSLLYGAGLVLAAFHPHKRALHDLICGSAVVYRLRGSGAPEERPIANARRLVERGMRELLPDEEWGRRLQLFPDDERKARPRSTGERDEAS